MSTTDALPSISAQWSVEPKKLSLLLRGDLDWIVMKSLEKDRTRRYESASNFAADVQRYLTDEPVEACPSSAGYKLRKFLRRNKQAVGVSLVIVLALMVALGAGLGSLVHSAQQQTRHERELLAAERGKVEQQRLLDEQQAGVKRKEIQRQQELSQQHDNLSRRVRDSLAEAERLRKQAISTGYDPLLLTRALDEVSRARSLLEGGDAEEGLAETADKIFSELSQAQRDFLMVDRLDAIQRDRETPKLLEQTLLPGSLKESSLKRNPMRLSLAEMERKRSGFQAAFAEYGLELGKTDVPVAAKMIQSRPLPIRDAGIASLHKATELDPKDVTAHNNLGWALMNTGDHEAAIAVLRQAIQLDPTQPRPYNNLGMALSNTGDYDADIAACRKSIELDPRNAVPHVNLSVALLKKGDYDAAIVVFRKAMQLNPKLPQPHTLLVEALNMKGDCEAAEKAIAEALALIRRLSGNDPSKLHSLLAKQASNLLKLNKYAPAETSCRECLAIREKLLSDHWLLFNAKSMLGASLLGQEKYAEAESPLLAGYEGLKQREEKIPTVVKIRLTQALQRLVELYEATGKQEEVTKWKAELDKWKAAEKAKSASRKDGPGQKK